MKFGSGCRIRDRSSNMSRFQGAVVCLQACDSHCGCSVDTLQVGKLKDWSELILEALDDYLMDEDGAGCADARTRGSEE